MRKIKEVLRLRFELGLGLRAIARSWSTTPIEMRGDSMRKNRGKPS